MLTCEFGSFISDASLLTRMIANLSGCLGLLLSSDARSNANAGAVTDKTNAPTIADTIERRVRKFILISTSVPNGGVPSKNEYFLDQSRYYTPSNTRAQSSSADSLPGTS